MVKEILELMDKCPTSYQAVENFKTILDRVGYQELKESENYDVKKGGRYYITRNDSSLLVVNIPQVIDDPSFKIVESHSDCPTFKLKPNSIIKDGGYIKLDTEPYGGALYYPWFDRPLSLAGRLIVKEDGRLKSVPFDLNEDFGIIPSLAIHQNRQANSGLAPNAQVDMLPIIGLKEDFDLLTFLKEKSGHDDIKSYDLYLYPRLKAVIYKQSDLFSAFHIDDLLGATLSLLSIIESKDEKAIDIAVIYDNEEVGSMTHQGAGSDFFKVNIKRIAKALDIDLYKAVARSFALSLDSAHAIHPAHPEKSEALNHPRINEGIVIKTNANQSYTTDALTSSIFKELLESNGIPYQAFANRSDERGGSTLGNIANMQLSIKTCDIGIAQLAMHSCYETAGIKDVEYLLKALHHFYSDQLIEFE